MKLGKLGTAVQTMIQPLKRLGATDSAETLHSLCSLLNELKDIEADAFIEKSKSVRANEDQGLTLHRVNDILDFTLEFMQAVGASAAKKSAMKSVKDCLSHAYSEMSFLAFSSQIKALLLINVVDFYAEALEISLGESGFDAAYAALEKDSRVTKPKLLEISARFVGRMAKSTTRPQMLKRIYDRHANLVNLAKKNEWQRGKSAA